MRRRPVPRDESRPSRATPRRPKVRRRNSRPRRPRFAANIQTYKQIAGLSWRLLKAQVTSWRGDSEEKSRVACELCDSIIGLILKFDSNSPEDIDCAQLCPFGMKSCARARAPPACFDPASARSIALARGTRGKRESALGVSGLGRAKVWVASR